MFVIEFTQDCLHLRHVTVGRQFLVIPASIQVIHKALAILLEIRFIGIIAIHINIDLHARFRRLYLFPVEILPELWKWYVPTPISEPFAKHTYFAVFTLIFIVLMCIKQYVQFPKHMMDVDRIRFCLLPGSKFRLELRQYTGTLPGISCRNPALREITPVYILTYFQIRRIKDRIIRRIYIIESVSFFRICLFCMRIPDLPDQDLLLRRYIRYRLRHMVDLRHTFCKCPLSLLVLLQLKQQIQTCRALLFLRIRKQSADQTIQPLLIHLIEYGKHRLSDVGFLIFEHVLKLRIVLRCQLHLLHKLRCFLSRVCLLVCYRIHENLTLAGICRLPDQK